MLRKAAGLTQKELAEAVGASQQSVAFWEKNARPPRADTLIKIAAALGVHADEVLGEGRQEATARQLPHHGPAGIVVRTFEEVRALPRHQQLKVVELVQVLLVQYKKKAS